MPRPFEKEKTRCSEQKDAFRDKENYVSLLPWMFISLILFMICPFLKWALLLFLTDDAKIRTICEVCKSCTREGKKDVRLTAVNHLLASCYNDKKYSLLIGHTDGRGGVNRPHRQLAVRNKPRAGGVKMCQGQNVSFSFSDVPELLYKIYIFNIYII